MRYLNSMIVATVLAIGQGGLPVEAQPCHRHDGFVDNMVAYAKQLITDPSLAETRKRYGLLPGTEADVTWIRDEGVCRAAAAAFALANGYKTRSPVIVVKVGTRYLVTDMTTTIGEFRGYMVFDQTWKLLAAFAS